MIKSPDVRKYFVEKLKKNGFNVFSSEIQEGFRKPATFLYVYPVKIQLYGNELEDDVYRVSILFIPKNEVMQECTAAAEEIRKIVFYDTADIDGRKITIESMEFEIDNDSLTVDFDVSITQVTERMENVYENTGILEMNM